MNDDKEQSRQEENKDWWFQYLSAEEKLEQQRATGLLNEQTVPEEAVEPELAQWRLLVKRMWKHGPKAALIVVIVLAVVHWGLVSVQLSKLNREHQGTLDILAQKEQEIITERELITQRAAALDAEKAIASKKEEELASGRQQMEKQYVERGKELERLRQSMQKVVGLSQEIYALKTEARQSSLIDLESDEEREEAIRKSWGELSELLKGGDVFERERELIKLRVIESQALSGGFDQQELDSIDWSTAKLEQERSMILARIYYKQAKKLESAGKAAEAVVLVESCWSVLPEMDQDGVEYLYVSAMLSEIDGDLRLKEQPKLALKSYLTAVDSLSEMVAEVPSNNKVRFKLAQLSHDVSVMPSVDGSSDWSNSLKKLAGEQAAWLVKQNSEYSRAHLILAKLHVSEAEKCLRDRDLSKVKNLLDKASQSLKLGGGDVLVQASIEEVHAFMAWERGAQVSAVELMDRQVKELAALIASDPSNQAAYCRCATLLWVRSMMQTSSEKARGDGNKALELLSSVLSGPSFLSALSAERMSARILCDLAEIEISSGSKIKAKGYLVRSEKLWREMRHKWGLSDADIEMEHWCAHQLTLL
ncbi:hypothetical protein [Rubritalea sp.]|uniref:hypothetical protein n=1 Tax=Rubritalea sp. TaxID=2109375 RepID=UPI003EFACB22